MPVWVRALIYMILVGSGWLVALPWGILRWENGTWFSVITFSQVAILGFIVFFAGFTLAIWAGYFLIRFGNGTPLPFDPPQQLVVTGPYKFVRNPQAISMMLMVTGEILIIRSAFLWILLPLTLLYLEGCVGPFETRQLESDYGSEYRNYASRVRKWIPIIKRSKLS